MTESSGSATAPDAPSPPSPPAPPSLQQRLVLELERVIAGQHDQIETILATLLSGGHVLLEDRPGVGKTVLARAIARVLGVGMGRIQGTPDLLPTDITGVHIYQPNTGEWTFRAGPIFASLLLVDELNRATPKAQSALLEAMAEAQVTVDGSTYSVPNPFMVIATQNPLGEIGTHALGAAQIDRFATILHLGLPGLEAERSILIGEAGTTHLNELTPVVGENQLPSLFAEVKEISACESIVGYILALVATVRALDPAVWLSVRVSETLLSVARGRAFMQERDYVAPEDVQHVALAVLAHRLPRTVDRDTVAEAVARVPIPTDAH